MSKDSEETSEERSRRIGSNARPRRFIYDVSSTPTPESRPILHTRTCPFCREHVGGEQNFREHLRTECEEAPREVNRNVSDWRDELDEFAPEDSEDSDESEPDSRNVSDRPDDAPGEVLPV